MESTWIWILGGGTLITALLGLLLVSLDHKWQRRAFYSQQVPVDEPTRRRLASIVGPEAAIASSVSVFDVMYHMWQLDSRALRGIDHLHHNLEFDNLQDLMTYMQYVLPDNDPQALKTIVDKYKGYTGEQVVYDALTEEGQHVAMADSPTQPGHDLILDDKPFNVKTTLDAGYVRQHLRQHPESDAIVPEELAAPFRDEPRVRVQANFSHDAVESATADTLEAIGDERAGQWFVGLPLITLVASSCRGYSKVRSGQLAFSTAVEHVVAETASKGFGRWTGAHIGLQLGLMLAPATGGLSAVFLPAGGSLLGVLLGGFAGGAIAQYFKGRHLRTAIKRLGEQAAIFHNLFIQRYLADSTSKRNTG